MERNKALDVLKLWLTCLVVFHHTAITYGAMGGWYYREIMPNASLTSKLLVYFCTINQAYFMGFFFLIAGYFTFPSLKEKGYLGLIKSRLLGFGLPIVVYGFGLGLITIALARTTKGNDFFKTLNAFYKNGEFEWGPLWFLKALLLFTLLTLIAEKLFKISDIQIKTFPKNTTLTLFALIMGLIAFIVRLYFPIGTEVWNFQLGYFPLYVLLFITGLCAEKGKWLENIPPEKVKLWRRIALFALPTIIPLGFFFEGKPSGGVNFAALFYALWEPFVAWGAIMWLLVYVKRFENFYPQLTNLSFGVYVIHPLIVVSVSVLLKSIYLPALIKFLLVGTISTILCFFVIYLYKKAESLILHRLKAHRF